MCYMRRCTKTGQEHTVLDLNDEEYASANLGQVCICLGTIGTS